MSQLQITNAGLLYKDQVFAGEQTQNITHFVFANIPNLNEDDAIDPDAGIPTEHIVHEQSVERISKLNSNAVVMSAVLGYDVGDFEYNYFGAVATKDDGSEVLLAVVHTSMQSKTKTEGAQTGNYSVKTIVWRSANIAQQLTVSLATLPWQVESGEFVTKEVFDTHNHDSDYLGINDKAADSSKFAGKLPSEFASFNHTHSIAQVSGLQVALDNKLNKDAIAADATRFGGYLPSHYSQVGHLHEMSEVSGLNTALNNKLSKTGVASDSAKLGGFSADKYEKKSNLGTAAYRDVGTQANDVMEVGAYGLGISSTDLGGYSGNARNCFVAKAGTELGLSGSVYYGINISANTATSTYIAMRDHMYWNSEAVSTNLKMVWDDANLNPVTVDTTQTITGTKLFSENVKVVSDQSYHNLAFMAQSSGKNYYAALGTDANGHARVTAGSASTDDVPLKVYTASNGHEGLTATFTSFGSLWLSDELLQPSGKLVISKKQRDVDSGALEDAFIRLHPNESINNDGFTGIAYGISTVATYGFSFGAQRTGTSAVGSMVARYHTENDSKGQKIFEAKHTGDLDVFGKVTANSYNTFSDERLKTKRSVIKVTKSQLQSLKAWRFDWLSTDDVPKQLRGKTDEGVMAQDVERIFPSCISTCESTGIKKVDYGKLAVLLQLCEVIDDGL